MPSRHFTWMVFFLTFSWENISVFIWEILFTGNCLVCVSSSINTSHTTFPGLGILFNLEAVGFLECTCHYCTFVTILFCWSLWFIGHWLFPPLATFFWYHLLICWELIFRKENFSSSPDYSSKFYARIGVF